MFELNIFIIIVSFVFQWKETDGSQLMDSKLKCVFVMPDILSGGSDTVANGTEKSSNDKPDSHHSIPTSVPTKSSSPKVRISTAASRFRYVNKIGGLRK